MKDLRSSTVGLVTAALLLLVFCGWLFVWNDDRGRPLPVVMVIGAGQSLLLYGLVVGALTTVVMIGRRPLLAWAATLLFGQRITDEATAYKLFKADLLKSLPLRCERFEFCPEVTARVLKSGVRIVETPML